MQGWKTRVLGCKGENIEEQKCQVRVRLWLAITEARRIAHALKERSAGLKYSIISRTPQIS